MCKVNSEESACFNCKGAGDTFAVDGCPFCADAVIEQEPEDHEVYNPHTDTWRTVKV